MSTKNEIKTNELAQKLVDHIFDLDSPYMNYAVEAAVERTGVKIPVEEDDRNIDLFYLNQEVILIQILIKAIDKLMPHPNK